MHEQFKNTIKDLNLTVLYLFIIHTGVELFSRIGEEEKLVWSSLPLWVFAVFQVISITKDRYEQKKKEEKSN